MAPPTSRSCAPASAGASGYDHRREIAEQAGALAARFVRSHPGIEVVDYVIAASVQRLDGELWTRNVRHFPMFPALAPPYGS